MEEGKGAKNLLKILFSFHARLASPCRPRRRSRRELPGLATCHSTVLSPLPDAAFLFFHAPRPPPTQIHARLARPRRGYRCSTRELPPLGMAAALSCQIGRSASAVNEVHGVPQDAVPACGDPLVTRSLGGRFADCVEFPEYKDGNTTESSSSFDASYSLSDDDVESDTGAMEVDSMFQSHINIDRSTLQKRKVTAEWRNYIGPVMWRCQWLELRMKDLLSQVEKYDKELAIINHEKDMQLEMMKADCSNSELLQLDHERNTMKRRKRKRDEDIIDSSLSTEKHLILSYYNEKQKKKTETDELLDDDDDDFNSLAVEDTKSSHDLSGTLAWLGFKDNDTVSEQCSLRDILFSINGMQSRVISLQNHLSKVLNTRVYNQKTKMVQKTKKLHSVLQEDTGSVAVRQPDGDEVTLEMLFGTNNPLTDVGISGLYKESDDDVLIDNQAARDEGYWQFQRISQKAEKHVDVVKSVETPYSEENSAPKGHESVSLSAPIVTPVNKCEPKPQKKHTTKKKRTQEDFNNSNTERTMLVAIDTRRSQRVRKPKIL